MFIRPIMAELKQELCFSVQIISWGEGEVERLMFASADIL